MNTKLKDGTFFLFFVFKSGFYWEGVAVILCVLKHCDHLMSKINAQAVMVLEVATGERELFGRTSG